MAHELMVPRGLKQRLIRRYERFLDGEKPLSTQNGAAQKARWNEEIFDAMLPGRPTVISNLNGSEEPTWRELNAFICCNGVDTFRGEIMAPHYEYRETGERVRVINYQDMKGTQLNPLHSVSPLTVRAVEVTAKQWHLMWDHVVCNFAYPNSPEDIEFRALHDAWNEISTIPEPWNDWQNPTGQQIAMIGKQLEHRLCSVHVGRPNPYGQSV